MDAMKTWTGALAVAAMAIAAPADAAQKGIGQYYNQKYESYGSSERMRSSDGRVAVIEESIETINCGGCDTVWYGPGVLLHLQNVGNRPVCAQLDFTRADEDDYSIDEFGSGTVHYIKPGKTALQVGGIYVISTGGSGTVNVGWGGTLHTWEPEGKNVCGEAR